MKKVLLALLIILTCGCNQKEVKNVCSYENKKSNIRIEIISKNNEIKETIARLKFENEEEASNYCNQFQESEYIDITCEYQNAIVKNIHEWGDVTTDVNTKEYLKELINLGYKCN